MCEDFICGICGDCPYSIVYDECIGKSCSHYGYCEVCIYNDECNQTEI